jgi:hypothetical protein
MKTLHLSIIAVSFAFFFIVSTMTSQAHADGLWEEKINANVGNRVMSMFIKINPPVLTSENLQDRYMQLRFFDANTNNPIKNVSFFLNATKGNQPLMYDLFYTKSGNLTIKFQPGGTVGKWTVYGDHEPLLGGWTSIGDEVNVQAPILSEGGLYHFNMALLAFDFSNAMVNSTTKINFTSYLSVGDIYNQTINYNSNSYNTILISYYDKINNFNFDPSKLQASWSMPFDWNPARYQDRQIFVHEEFHIPKSFKEFTNTPTYFASVNGNPITGRRVIADPYTPGDSMIVHLLINKIDIQNMEASVPSGTNTMDFTLAPAAANITTSSSVLTDVGAWGIKLGWFPTQIIANTKNNLNLNFFDALNEQQVTGDVNYDFKILDNDGNTVISQKGLTAKGGVDTQSINLPSNGIYKIELSIKSIVYNGIPDTTRIGLARGDLVIPSNAINEDVVPEFPFAIPVLLISIISLLVFYRFKFRMN